MPAVEFLAEIQLLKEQLTEANKRIAELKNAGCVVQLALEDVAGQAVDLRGRIGAAERKAIVLELNLRSNSVLIVMIHDTNSRAIIQACSELNDLRKILTTDTTADSAGGKE